MSSLQADYSELLVLSKKLTVLRTTSSIVQWDLETMMPPQGLEQRAEQLALLDIIGHQALADPRVGKLLDRIEKASDFESLGVEQKRNVHLMRKSFNEESKLPERLVEELAKQQAITVDKWKKAKAAKDFKIYRDDLERMFDLKKEAAVIMREVKGTHTDYDALLDIFEPGMTADRISEVFTEMRNGLIKVMNRIEASGTRPDLSIVSRRVPVSAQKRMSQAIMDFIHYPTSGPSAWGRLDETEHPFTTGYYGDVRITTHYYEDRFVSSLYSVMHEGGHALYDGGMNPEWKWQPIGSPSSYGIHESQSRFVENMVGRSPEFLAYLLPRIRKITGKAFLGVGMDDFAVAVNAVQPSKIRIEADEVTYGLHVIIRFELEKEIMTGRLSVDELPQAWDQKYLDYLGVKVKNDSEGVMQDTHWAGGAIGYFPSYALGNLYGGMFLRQMEKDLPEWRAGIRKGDFGPVRAWLANNIHSRGNLYDPADLVKVVTGEQLQVEPFISYLDEKFSAIYGY